MRAWEACWISIYYSTCFQGAVSAQQPDLAVAASVGMGISLPLVDPPMPFTSSMRAVLQREPPYTNVNAEMGFVATLDYMFCSGLKVQGTLDVFQDQPAFLPNETVPSDHVPLCSVFRFPDTTFPNPLSPLRSFKPFTPQEGGSQHVSMATPSESLTKAPLFTQDGNRAPSRPSPMPLTITGADSPSNQANPNEAVMAEDGTIYAGDTALSGPKKLTYPFTPKTAQPSTLEPHVVSSGSTRDASPPNSAPHSLSKRLMMLSQEAKDHQQSGGARQALFRSSEASPRGQSNATPSAAGLASLTPAALAASVSRSVVAVRAWIEQGNLGSPTSRTRSNSFGARATPNVQPDGNSMVQLKPFPASPVIMHADTCLASSPLSSSPNTPAKGLPHGAEPSSIFSDCSPRMSDSNLDSQGNGNFHTSIDTNTAYAQLEHAHAHGPLGTCPRYPPLHVSTCIVFKGL